MLQPQCIFMPKPGDYPQIIEVWEESVRATHDFLPDSYIEILKHLLLTQYLDAVSLFCVRGPNQKISGFAGASLGKLEMLFLGPEYRGQGLGKLLLHYALENFDARELDVNEQNTQAVGFYLKQGFKVIGRTEEDGLGQPFPILRMRLEDDDE
jgi:putative acetyltransferase